MADLVDSIARGTRLGGYRKLPVMEARPAFFTHRASGDTIVVLVTAKLGPNAEDDHHGGGGGTEQQDHSGKGGG